MYKNILVPLSFDEDQVVEAVLKAAATLADQDAVVTLIHVMSPVPDYASSYFPAGYKDEARASIEASLSTMARDLPNARSVVCEGRPSNVILAWIKDHGIDCVIMSAHKPGTHEFNLGTTAAQVIRHVSCAVHVAR
ncbi:MAG: universal stress protein [Pseudomonadota bacterium]|nr:universal stress protein [Pseudomonadota bacterium]